MELNVVRGGAVLAMLNEDEFRVAWDNLISSSDTFLTCSSYGFIIPWYDYRSTTHEPLLIVGYEQDQLVGLVLLARRKADDNIVIAGDQDAEYHGWVARTSSELAFVTESLRVIQKLKAQSVWRWHYLPKGLNATILGEVDIPGIKITMKHSQAALWDMNDAELMAKFENGKARKKYKRRLDDRGEVQIEVIQNGDRLREILEIVRLHNDFRYEALYGFRLFDENPGLIDFCSGMLDQKVAHNIAYWQNDELIAYSNYIGNGTQAYPGITAYKPSLSRLSLGKMMVVDHARHLMDSGFRYMDFTPGEDAYKNNYATEQWDVYQPTIYFSPIAFTKDQCREKAISISKSLLLKFNCTPKKLKSKIANFQYAKKHFGLVRKSQSSFKTLSEMISKDHQFSLYDMSTLLERQTGDAGMNVEIDMEEKIRLYNDHRPFADQESLLWRAWYKFNKAQSCFTIDKNNQLCMYGWIADPPKKVNPLYYDDAFLIPEKTVILYDIYFNSSLSTDEIHACLNVVKSRVDVDYKKPIAILINHDQAVGIGERSFGE